MISAKPRGRAKRRILNDSVFPPAEQLQHGDLIWCRAKYSLLFRDVAADTSLVPSAKSDYTLFGPTTEADWIAERDAFIDGARAAPRASAKAREDAESIAHMSLGEFLARYRGGDRGGAWVEAADRSQTLSLDSQTLLSTGHVAIIAVDARGRRLVLEACRPRLKPPKTYERWLTRFRRPFLVWHGRLRVKDPSLRGAVADTARRWLVRDYTHRPFSLWNFDLDDPRAFYCAKFVWMAVYRASKRRVGLDGRKNPKRGFLDWCTPRRIMRGGHVRLLFDPRRYGLVD